MLVCTCVVSQQLLQRLPAQELVEVAGIHGDGSVVPSLAESLDEAAQKLPCHLLQHEHEWW